MTMDFYDAQFYMPETEAALERQHEYHPFRAVPEHLMCDWCGAPALALCHGNVVEELTTVLYQHERTDTWDDGVLISRYGCTCGQFEGASDSEHRAHVARAIYVHLQTRLEALR